MSTIAVISHLWQGHIPAYHRLLAARLLSAGHRVFSLAPVAEEELELIAEPGALIHLCFGQSPATQLRVEDQVRSRPAWRRLLDRSGGAGFLKRAILLELLRSARLWKSTSASIEALEKTTGANIDMAILVYPAVGYLCPTLPAFIVDTLFPVPWVGIWNGPEMLADPSPPLRRKDRAFRARHCRGVLVPDTSIRDGLGTLDPSLRVYAMPEIADLRPAQANHPQVAQISRDAEGRHIVGLLGNITLRKGILSFIKLAALAWTRQRPIFFVAAGDFSLSSCGDEFDLIDEACRTAPKNFRLYPKRLADGPVFNAHVMACDVIFAAYHNFPFQSNLLTKAAAFAKPVIVSQGFIMERRTVEYDLGLAVPQDDAEKALQAATVLLELPPSIRRRYADYLNANSLDALDQVLAKLVALPA